MLKRFDREVRAPAPPVVSESLGAQSGRIPQPDGPNSTERLAYRAVAWTFGSLLLAASTLKVLAAVRTSGAAVGDARLQQGIVIAAAVAEWAVSLWLFSGVRPRTARRVTLAVLCAFIVWTGWRWAEGARSCGCFGAVEVRPYWTLSLDLAVLAGFYWLGRASSNGQLSPSGRRRTTLGMNRTAVALAWALALPALTFLIADRELNAARHGRAILLDTGSLRGKPCPLLDFVDAETRRKLVTGDVTVAIVDRNCSHCQAYLRALDGRVATQPICVADLATATDSDGPLNLNPGLTQIALFRELQVTGTIPIELRLRNGVVVETRHPEAGQSERQVSDREGN